MAPFVRTVAASPQIVLVDRIRTIQSGKAHGSRSPFRIAVGVAVVRALFPGSSDSSR